MSVLFSTYSLSKQQERTWFLRELHPGNPVFTIASLITVDGELKTGALQAALFALIERHESLRTVFRVVDGTPQACVLPSIETPLRLVADDGSDVGPWAVATARDPLYATTEPLWRLSVRSVGSGRHAMLLMADQLIVDRCSLATLVHDLAALYTEQVTGVPAALRPVAGFSHVAQAEQLRLLDPAAETLLQATADLFAALPAGIELPTDRLRAPILTFAGDQFEATVPWVVADEVEKYCEAHQVAAAPLMLAAFAALVHRYTGVDDVVVGVPHGASTTMVGPISDLELAHFRFESDPTFVELLDQARGVETSDDHVPFGMLVERLDSERDLSRRPLCQLSFDVRHPVECRFADSPAVAVVLNHAVSSFDLSVTMRSIGDTLALAIDFDTSLFERATVERLAGNLFTLLLGMLTSPEEAVSRHPLVAGEQLREIVDFSAGEPMRLESEHMVHELIAARAEQTPDAVALVDGERRVTYGEVNSRANSLANHLRQLGVGPQVNVGVCLPRCVEMVIAVLGVLKAGGAAALLDPAHPPRRLAFMLDDCGAPVLVTSEALLPTIPASYAGQIRCVDRDADVVSSAGDHEPPVWAHPQARCQIAYTSGSTGEPRGVEFTHRAVRMVAAATQRTYSLTSGDSGTWISSPGFGISFVNELWPFLTIGATVHIAHENTVSSPFRLRDWLVDQRITVSVLPKALAERVCAADWPRDTAMRVLMVSGERCGWLSATVPFEVVVIYGSTETTNATTCLNEAQGWRFTPRAIPEADRRSATAPVGLPVPGARVYVLDGELRIVPTGVTGQIFVGGELIQGGYLHRPGPTAMKWIPDPYAARPGERMVATGDVGKRLPDGTIEILGRADEQISLNGYRIELGEISSRLLAHPAVRQVAVMVVDVEPGQRRMVAYVVPEPNRRPTSADLRELLSEQVPAYMVPALFVMLEALPMLPNGKVDRRSLPIPGAARDSEQTFVAASTVEQEKLSAIWRHVLHRERIGVLDNYFELGGDSLSGMELMASISTEFGITLPLRALFEAPTVEQMTAMIGRAGKSPDSVRSGADHLPDVPTDPNSRHDPFPLTDIQHAYWVGRAGGLELGDVGCHGYQEWDVDEIDIERLEKAIDRLVRRHDMLRAIVTRDGRQRVLAEVPRYAVRVTDLRLLPRQQREQNLARLRDELSHEVLSSDEWPLFQVRVSLTEGDRARIHISFDLLIFDARSARVFTQELTELYHDPDRALPELTLSFRDYVLAERAAQQDSPAYLASARYWLERLDELPPAPALPYRQSMAAVRDPRFVRHDGRLEPPVWQRLRQAAAKAGITPSALLLAAYAEVLAMWSTQDRFTINLTLFNRPPLHPQLNDILGDFTSGLLHAVDGGGPTFADRARSVQEQLWRDLEHRFVSSVQVMRDLNRRQQASAPRAAMPVVFSSLVGVPRMEWGNLGTYAFGVTQTPQVALDLQVMEVDGGLDFAWDAVAQLFPDGMIGEMAAACGQLLHRLADSPDVWQASRPVPLPADQVAVRDRVNSTERPLPVGLLHEALVDQFSRRPAAPAIICAGRTMTFGELDRVSAAIAQRLGEIGVAPDRLVAVLMRKGWEQIAAVVGVLRAGAAYLPIDPALPAERINYLVGNGEVAAVLTQAEHDASIGAVPTIVVDDGLKAPAEPIVAVVEPNHLAYVIYTSGSTGEPKGVMIEHHAALNTVLDINQRFDIGPSDRVLAVSSLSFDLSVWDIFGVLGAGGALVMPPASENPDPRTWVDLMADNEVTVWNSAPALFQIVSEYCRGRGERLSPSLRTVMLSGDWIPPSTVDHVRDLTAGSATLISLGGATEGSIWSIAHVVGPQRPDWVSVPYGLPLANQRWHVLDDRLAPRPDWVTGGLYIAGRGLARGYWRDEQKTDARFVPHPVTGERLYRTGDLGRYRPGGELEILGREDFQVKILGHRVELGEIESALDSHPDVAASCVVAIGEHRSALRLVAHFVAEAGAAPSGEELRAHLAGRLLADIVPARYHRLDALPLTANGKVDRASLVAFGDPLAVAAASAPPTSTAPASRTEELLLKVAMEVLDGTPIAPGDNFFTIGGDSLRAIAVINAAAEVGIDVPVELFFQNPTMGALAAEVEALAGASQPVVHDLRSEAV